MAVETPVTVTRKMAVLFFDPRFSDLRVKDDKLQEDSVFVYTPNDGEGEADRSTSPQVALSCEEYDELRAPAHITIAIYPGDRQDFIEQEDFPA